MTARPEAILFDYGGTLAHMDPAEVGARVGTVRGVPPTVEQVAEAHYRALAEFADGERMGTDPDWWPAWIRAFVSHLGADDAGEGPVTRLAMAEGIWTSVVPGAFATLQRLRAAGFRLAVISNADGTVESRLRLTGLLPHFEFVIDSHLVGRSKPDPAIFAMALERMGVAPAAAWYVGDSPYHDVGGATAAGLAAAVLVDPFDLHPRYALRVATVADLPGLLPGPL